MKMMVKMEDHVPQKIPSSIDSQDLLPLWITEGKIIWRTDDKQLPLRQGTKDSTKIL